MTLPPADPLESIDDFIGHIDAELGLGPARPDDRLFDDLGFDSLLMLEFLYVVEDLGGGLLDESTIPFDRLTVADAYALALDLRVAR